MSEMDREKPGGEQITEEGGQGEQSRAERISLLLQEEDVDIDELKREVVEGKREWLLDMQRNGNKRRPHQFDTEAGEHGNGLCAGCQPCELGIEPTTKGGHAECVTRAVSEGHRRQEEFLVTLNLPTSDDEKWRSPGVTFAANCLNFWMTDWKKIVYEHTLKGLDEIDNAVTKGIVDTAKWEDYRARAVEHKRTLVDWQENKIPAYTEEIRKAIIDKDEEKIFAVSNNLMTGFKPSSITQEEGNEFAKDLSRAKRLQRAAKKPSKRKRAKETAITALPDNVALITAKQHAHALTPVKNSTAYIQQLQADYIDTLIFDNETGRIQFKGENFHEEVTLQKLSTRQAVKELDLPLLRSLYTVIYNNAEMIRGGEVSVYVPTLCRHLDIDIQTGKPAELFKKILAFKDVVGVMGKSFYKMLEFSSYENETNIITFSSPYMNKILRALQNNPDYKVAIGKTGGFMKPAHSFLIHGSIYKERNKPAIEIAISLVTLLQQRGEAKRFIRKDKKVTVERLPDTTAHIKFSTLIKGIPLLAETIQEQGNPQDRNRIIKRAFTGGFDLLRTQTDIYKYYLNLNIPDYIPTMTQLNRNLEMTHEGINPDYKP